ncbi:hypothetical protein L6654_33840 [Bradyrhizobium sp. WYCCWR 13023]|uniref:Uncharacterized protein n=1 Tax=Bradyrhizobium zhengyangense TaxID=2911009 RepID=A0A9X1UJL4_9BRAD|nr:hypothetical protein [Bradyrhizobium zhengyangense]MCG2631622.1 hypothetical protein [Bradyrhizobium zhengyangense]
MDMKQSSGMTKASGLTDEQGSLERASASQSTVKTRSADGSATRPIVQHAAVRWAERLRKVTVEAPVPSLLAAFVLGIWFAHRR